MSDYRSPMPAGSVGPTPASARLLEPVRRFLSVEAASGVVLLSAAAAALIWASSRWSVAYFDLWRVPLTFGVIADVSAESLRFWINDGLMALFLLLVGLEIRREMHDGVLAKASVAAVPVIAAFGGVVVPASIFLVFNIGTPARNGWGVPMATDIAFAIGVLTLLGARVPAALRVLLLAIAIADDVMAIIVIALYYSTDATSTGLLVAAAGVLATLLLQRLGVRVVTAYALAGVVIWFGLYQSHIHPSIAGVMLGLLIPVRGDSAELRSSPARRLESALHPWVAYAVMPLFALANAGVSLGKLSLHSTIGVNLLFGVVLGLVAGKPIGILLATLGAVKLGVATLPDGVNWRGVALIGIIAGIGFTMAIFISNLAFANTALLDAAKFSVLMASTISAVAGLTFGWLALRGSRDAT